MYFFIFAICEPLTEYVLSLAINLFPFVAGYKIESLQILKATVSVFITNRVCYVWCNF